MSGSPIIDAGGHAVGGVALSTGDDSINPRLMAALPGWFLQELAAAKSDCEDDQPS
jgi:hypothetical protein